MPAFHEKFKDSYNNIIITNEHFTGYPVDILNTIKRSISAIVSKKNGVEFFYIGIASGANFYDALVNRIDEKKYAHGTTRMYLLYASSCRKFTATIEREMIWDFEELDKEFRLWNDAEGGGGRHGKGPFYFVYLAVSNRNDWKRLAKLPKR